MKRTNIRIDASGLSKADCMLRLRRIIVDGYREKEIYNDTQYGSAYHLFVSTMHHTKGDVGTAVFAAQDSFKKATNVRQGKKHLTDVHLIKTCMDYWEHFSKKDDFQVVSIDGKPCVEFNFEIKILEYGDYDFYLCGTMDKFGKFANGCYAIGDYKTHSLWSVSKDGDPKYAIASFFKKFELSPQLRTYLLALKLITQNDPTSELAKICQGKIGMFIDGVFLDSKKDTLFARSEVFFLDDATLNSHLEAIKQICINLVNHDGVTRDGITIGACYDHKYPCQFCNVCINANPAIQQMVLDKEFTRTEYNPLLFGK